MKRIIQLSAEQKSVYEQNEKTGYSKRSMTTATALTQLMRLQQITCGHFKDDHAKLHSLKIIVFQNF